MAGLSGLLTGLPPFMTAGSLVLLLGGADVLGTVSPISCSEGSLYMATKKGGRKIKHLLTLKKACFCDWLKNMKDLYKTSTKMGHFPYQNVHKYRLFAVTTG